MKDIKGTKTEQNLREAYAGESQARNKYTYYASKARKDGFEQIAAIFEETANNEKEHAKLWFKMLHGNDIPGTLDNLRDAADGQTLSFTDMNAPLGTVSYTAIAYNAQGASVPATANARSGLDYDLAVTDISADPVKVVAGESFTIKATVLNNGSMPTPDDDANRYTVVLREVTDNDRVALDSSFGDRLMSEESAEFSFVCATNDESVGVHRYEVSAMFPDATLDENSDNNVSKIIEVVVEAAQHDGIAAVGADSAIEINGRQITLRAAGAIYNVAGVCVFTNYFDAPRSVTLPAGIYLINIDNKILKVII